MKRALAPVTRRPGRFARSAALGLAAVLSLGACSFISPQQLDVPYSPGDGIEVQLPDVVVHDLLSVNQGGKMQLFGYVANTTAQPVTVKIGPADGASQPISVQLGPLEAVQLSTRDITFPRPDGVMSGELVPYFVTSDQGSKVGQAPLMPATGYYAPKS